MTMPSILTVKLEPHSARRRWIIARSRSAGTSVLDDCAVCMSAAEFMVRCAALSPEKLCHAHKHGVEVTR